VTTALNGLGYAYYYGNGVEKNFTKALFYFERCAVADGDKEATFNAALMHRDGVGTKKDMAKAFKWFNQAASKGQFAAIREVHYKGPIPHPSTLILILGGFDVFKRHRGAAIMP